MPDPSQVEDRREPVRLDDQILALSEMWQFLKVGGAFQPRIAVVLTLQIAAGKPLPQRHYHIRLYAGTLSPAPVERWYFKY